MWGWGRVVGRQEDLSIRAPEDKLGRAQTTSSAAETVHASPGFLRSGSRARRLLGAGLHGCGVQAIQQECMGFTGLLQHGKRACVPGTSWHTCQAHTSALCVHACAHACVCVCVCVPLALGEYWHCLGVQRHLCLTGANWGSSTDWPGTHAWGTNPERSSVGKDVMEGPSSAMVMPLRLSSSCWGPEWYSGLGQPRPSPRTPGIVLAMTAAPEVQQLASSRQRSGAGAFYQPVPDSPSRSHA